MDKSHTKPPPSREGTGLGRRITRLALGVALGLGALCYWFNNFFYPSHGLRKIPREQYQKALLAAGASFAASESLEMKQLISSRFRESGPRDRAYVWGTFRLRNSQGAEVFLWTSLNWSVYLNRWERESCVLLADPRNPLPLAPSILSMGNLAKISLTMQYEWREEQRRLRSVWRHGWGTGESLAEN
jgi:hypothetical protein